MKHRILLLGVVCSLVGCGNRPASRAALDQNPESALAGVPSEKQFADALARAKEKGYIAQDMAYADSVSAAFLPK